jgi:hypothetical protein
VVSLSFAAATRADAQAPVDASLRFGPTTGAALGRFRPELPPAREVRADSTMNWNKVSLGVLLGAAGGAAAFALLQGVDDSPDDGPEFIWSGAVLGAVVGLFVGLAWGSE